MCAARVCRGRDNHAPFLDLDTCNRGQVEFTHQFPSFLVKVQWSTRLRKVPLALCKTLRSEMPWLYEAKNKNAMVSDAKTLPSVEATKKSTWYTKLR